MHQVIVILEMTTALSFTRSTRFAASGAAESWAVTGTGDNGSRTAVAMSTGSTFAYLLLAPKWGAKQPHQRIQAWAEDLWRLQ